MKQLHFDSPYAFAEFFKEKSPEVTNMIVHAIRESIEFQKKTAKLFEMTIGNEDSVFELSLPRKEWVTVLENCLKHYEEWEMSDDAIDTWQLIQQVKEWKN
jgi:hypothetical protein